MPSETTINGKSGFWQRFWFPPSTTFGLSVCRILASLTMVLFFLPSWEKQLWVISRDDFEGTQTLVDFVLVFISEETFRSETFLRPIYLGALIAGWFAVFGLFTRPALFILAVGAGILQAHEYSYGRVSHPEGIFIVFLLALSFSPSNRCLSIDSLMRRSSKPSQWGPDAVRTDAVWPMRLAQLLLGLAYLSAAVAKLMVGGITWMNGYTLQTVMLRTYANYEIRDPDHLEFGKALCAWLMKQYELLVLLSVATIVWEALFIVAVFSKRLRPWFLIGGIGLHTSIWLAQNAPFHEWMVLYATFLNWELIRAWFRKDAALPASPATA